jgi:hypothetical protein
VEVHVREEAEDERVEGEAGEVGEEGGEGAAEEGPERGRGERVEAEEDGEGKGEEVAGGRGGADGGSSEADREWGVEHLGERRGEESREMRPWRGRAERAASQMLTRDLVFAALRGNCGPACIHRNFFWAPLGIGCR